MLTPLNFHQPILLPFLIPTPFLPHTTSLPLLLTNLLNILSPHYFPITFLQYPPNIILPNIFSILPTTLILFFFYRKTIPLPYHITPPPHPNQPIPDPP
ncbi:ArsB/NhaD family transporter, partial [Paenibacillus xylanexedens]|uniref:ArsB/NhaD family transporter n=1 Tax=Paenibacillus xylanexedens TaxID=528191 RepID=UPI0034D9684E